MTLIIKRKSGILGTFSKEKVLINGQHTALLANNSQIAINLVQSPSEFSLKGVLHSKKMVQDGQTLVISGNPLYLIGVFISVVFLFGRFALYYSPTGNFITLLGSLGLFLTFFLVPKYNISFEEQ